MTFFYKRIFPIIFFGFILLFIAFGLFGGLRSGQSPPLPVLIAPMIVFAVVYFVMKKLVFDLVDEVLDAGDALIVRNGGQQERVALSDIMNVSYSPLVSPPRVTLSLRRPSTFGSEVTFCAPIRLMPLSPSPIHQRPDPKNRRSAPAMRKSAPLRAGRRRAHRGGVGARRKARRAFTDGSQWNAKGCGRGRPYCRGCRNGDSSASTPITVTNRQRATIFSTYALPELAPSVREGRTRSRRHAFRAVAK